MPIYAYRCSACGHAKDVLQKLSDPMLSTCPACGAEAFAKQLTAAGFQLKGSGWYATDFKGGGSAKPAGAGSGDKPGSETKGDTKGDTKPDTKADTKSDASPAASAGSCGGSCACH